MRSRLVAQAVKDIKPGTDVVRAGRAPLSAEELRKMDAYWRASNYLSVGQIYLLDNPLLKEPLKREHIKPPLLGHWGSSPASSATARPRPARWPPAGRATSSSTPPATAACCRSCT